MAVGGFFLAMASSRSKKVRWWGGTPETCFVLGACALLLAGTFHVAVTITRERTDGAGRTIYDPEGDPVMEVDKWATFWANGPSHFLGIGAGVMIIRGLVLLARHSY